MNYFLEEAARDVYKRYPGQLQDLCIVFPNRRSGVFFRYYLGKTLDKPSWSPHITTISDLMQDFSGLQKADTLSMVFMLYEIYKKEKKSTEPFDEFYLWGEMLLHDFEDIDKYLVEPRDLFQNLASLKSIEDKFPYLTEEQINTIQRFWDTINMDRLSDEQSDFVSIWEVLYNVYFQFNSKLDDKKLGYEGKIYRTVIDKLNAGKLSTEYSKYIFIGFNALTTAEKKLFRFLNTHKLADFYWDYDHYYLDKNEAGQFIKQNLKEFPGNKLPVNDHFNENKQIQYVNTSYDIAQAKVLPYILVEYEHKQEKPDQSAIILPDEHLLLPVLNSIPETYKKVNVTMGYPVYLTPAFSLLLSLIKLQQNVKKLERNTSFYYKDVLSVLNHQYMGMLKNDQTEQIITAIHQHNKVYVDLKDLKIGGFFNTVFQAPGDYRLLSQYLMENYYNFYRSLKESAPDDNKSLQLELECIYNVYLAIKRLAEIFGKQNVAVKNETYLKILERIIQNQSIAFRGEPLSGLQVMGILETRALDFENLVILSMNEGIIPKAESNSTFIPYSIRKGFGMPTFEQNDSMYAYYFYRLIQRAKNITLIYNSGSEGTHTGEMSRFMQQLKFESKHIMEEKTVISDINIPEVKDLKVAKNLDVLERLEEYNRLKNKNSHLSPSAINTYLRCSLQFYYKYVAKLKEPDELAEDIDPRIFGLLLHKTIELIYQKYKEEKIEVTKDELDAILKDENSIEQHIIQAFKEEYFTDAKQKTIDFSGKNLLIKDVLFHYVKQFLKVEKKFTPFLLLDLEQKYQTTIDFEVSGNNKQVMIRGTIDRLDENTDGIRVIDYKSGDPKSTFNDLESLFRHDGNHAALQALIYSKMIREKFGNDKAIIPGLYFIRNLFQNFDYRIKMNKKTFIYQELEHDFNNKLQETLTDIFNPEIPFQQTEDEKICRNCPYKRICRRGQ